MLTGLRASHDELSHKQGQELSVQRGNRPTGTSIVRVLELMINWKLNTTDLFEYWTRPDLEISPRPES